MRLARHYAGRHALVTGGSLGIGRAVAGRLVGLGAGVTLVARGEERLETAREELLRARPGARVRVLALDVSDAAAVAAALPRELAEQPVDLLVASAGTSHVGRFVELGPDELRADMEVNYFGTVWTVRAVVPHLLERGGGRIAILGSMASIMGIYGYAAYTPPKFALHGLAQVLHAELRPLGIRVSVVLPPSTDTPMLQRELETAPPETLRIIGSTRVLSAETVADALLHGVARGRFEIVPGVDNRLVALATRWAPAASRRILDLQVGAARREAGRARAG